MSKLDLTIENLINDNKIKSKWTEIENYGIAEMINVMFQDEVGYGAIGHNTIIESMVVCLTLHEGIPYKYEGEYQTLIKAYIDVDDNVVFASSQGNVYVYEAETIDAADPKHYHRGE